MKPKRLTREPNFRIEGGECYIEGTRVHITFDLARDIGPTRGGGNLLIVSSRGIQEVAWPGLGTVWLTLNAFRSKQKTVRRRPPPPPQPKEQ